MRVLCDFCTIGRILTIVEDIIILSTTSGTSLRVEHVPIEHRHVPVGEPSSCNIPGSDSILRIVEQLLRVACGDRGSVKLQHSSSKRHSRRTCPQFRLTDTQPASISALFRARRIPIVPFALSRFCLALPPNLDHEYEYREYEVCENTSVPKSRL